MLNALGTLGSWLGSTPFQTWHLSRPLGVKASESCRAHHSSPE